MLRNLSDRTDVVIKSAEKWGVIVIMITEDYIKEAGRQLGHKIFYKQVDTDPTLAFKDVVQKALSELLEEKKINEAVAKSLPPLSPTASRLYLLPKIHQENNPGRHIVSGIGTITKKISRYVDVLIQGIPPSFASYIKDTTHYLHEIFDLGIPTGFLLVTLDT